jgi:hypothetical protein
MNDKNDMNDANEKILKDLAKRYADAHGASLLSELKDMEQQKVRYLMPRADEQIRKLAGKRTLRRKTIGWACAIAACLVLVVSIPNVLSAPPGSGGDLPGQAVPPATDWNQVQLLSFELPAEFEVSNTELDNGMTIYSLDGNAGYDNVVLTLECPPDLPESIPSIGMETIYIHGYPVPAKVDDRYKILRFENEGTLYTLSCKEDVGTLAYLYSHIVET